MCFSTAALTCKTDDTTSGLDTLDNWIKCFAAAIFYRVKPHEKIVVKCKCGAILGGNSQLSNMRKHSTQIGDFLKSHQSMWKNIEIIFGHSKSHQST